MNPIGPSPSSVPLAGLAHTGFKSPGAAPADKTRDMTQQFEAVFVRHLLNEAQKPVLGGGALPASSSRGIYQDMMVERWADQISQSGSFGVARSLELQIRQSSPVSISTPEAAFPGAKSLP